MKKTLEDELMSLAHRILRLRGREDLEQMKVLTGELYEKLSILSFAEKHFSGPRPTIGLQDVAETLSEIKKVTVEPESEPTVEQKISSTSSIQAEEKPEKVDEQEKETTKEDIEEPEVETPTLPEEDSPELKPDLEKAPKPSTADIQKSVETEDSSEIDLREISVHFDDLPQFEPVSFNKTKPEPEMEIPTESIEYEEQDQPKDSADQAPSLGDLFPTSPKAKNKNDLSAQRRSLNESLNVGLSFGLNDRLAFINNLFDGRAEDFNRVISQLNSFEHYSEAQDFIEEQIKPDYNWEDKTTYEERFLQALEQRMEE